MDTSAGVGDTLVFTAPMVQSYDLIVQDLWQQASCTVVWTLWAIVVTIVIAAEASGLHNLCLCCVKVSCGEQAPNGLLALCQSLVCEQHTMGVMP